MKEMTLYSLASRFTDVISQAITLSDHTHIHVIVLLLLHAYLLTGFSHILCIIIDQRIS